MFGNICQCKKNVSFHVVRGEGDVHWSDTFLNLFSLPCPLFWLFFSCHLSFDFWQLMREVLWDYFQYLNNASVTGHPSTHKLFPYFPHLVCSFTTRARGIWNAFFITDQRGKLFHCLYINWMTSDPMFHCPSKFWSFNFFSIFHIVSNVCKLPYWFHSNRIATADFWWYFDSE